MLGNYSENTTKREYRDAAEYAVAQLLADNMAGFQAQGRKVTVGLLQSFRDNWKTSSGEPMDLTTHTATIREMRALLDATGVETYGGATTDADIAANITGRWKNYIKEYRDFQKDGMYLHAVTDPELRAHAFGEKSPTRVVFAHKGASLRHLDPNTSYTLHNKRGDSEIYNGTISATAPGVAGPAFDGVASAARPEPAPAEVIAQAEDEFDTETDTQIDSERLLGWEGGVVDGTEYRGLSHLMGAYFTNADGQQIAKNIDRDEFFRADDAHTSVEMLQYMRSNGISIQAIESKKRNQINVRAGIGERTEVRLFDPEKNGQYMGRVYDGVNMYNFNYMGPQSEAAGVDYRASDAIAILKYISGEHTGAITKAASKDTTSVKLEGVDRHKGLYISPMKNAFASTSFEDEAEAEAFIRDAIASAQEYAALEFKADEIQAIIDEGIDSEEFLYTDPEIQNRFEALYSHDVIVRAAQEEAVLAAIHSESGGREKLDELSDGIVGNYEDGFNTAFAIDHMGQTERRHERNAMIAALKLVDYDPEKIKGNDFAVNALKERLVKFDPETAKTIDEVDNPRLKAAMETVKETLISGNLRGERVHKGADENFKFVKHDKEPTVMIDDNGVIRWEATRETGKRKPHEKWQSISGEIGQVMVPDEHGIIKTNFQNDNNYGIVPGYTGYFSFEGDYDNRMERFRAKGFDQHLHESLKAKTVSQMIRPIDKATGNIPTVTDTSDLNSLYHGEVYGKRIDKDFMELNQMPEDMKAAMIQTLSNRVRFDNQYSDYATTSAETQAKRENSTNENVSEFSFFQAAGGVNMRVLQSDTENYADQNMTGTGKTQGLIWYLVDGAEVNPDGSVTPSKGLLQADGTMGPDKTALAKTSAFAHADKNAWVRPQMTGNALLTANRIDKNVGFALMSFGQWNQDDAYPASKDFAKRNQVFSSMESNENSMNVLDGLITAAQGEDFDKKAHLEGTYMNWTDEVVSEGIALQQAADADYENLTDLHKAEDAYEDFLEQHGRFRDAQRGDKITDSHGNKGTISIVIDRDMSPEDARAIDLEEEVAFMKANPGLDVIGSPYSLLSRQNAGVVHEMMDGPRRDAYNPQTGETYKDVVGELDIIVTDMNVDDKTHAYTEDDQGRKASGQLAWALQAKDATGITNEIYGHNDAAWSTFREYLIATGFDMKPDGTVVKGYEPHHEEERHVFQHDPDVDASGFLNEIREQGGFLELPFELELKSGVKTTEMPVLSASLRQDVELIDGTMRRSDFTNHYANIYEAVGDYTAAQTDAEREKAMETVQGQFNQVQSTIIDRQINGGHNGKNSFIRDKMMGKRMKNSATAVAMSDPRLDIGEAGMNQAMMDSLNAKEGDTVMMWRDPVWRDGAVRAMTVKYDETVHGVSFNPISAKSHDGDFDGDTYGLIKLETPEAIRDLKEKFGHASNMIDKGSGKDELYFQSGMDYASAEHRAREKGDTKADELMEKVQKNAVSDDPRARRAAVKDLSTYAKHLAKNYGIGAAKVSVTDRASIMEDLEQMVEEKAKGKPGKDGKKGSVEEFAEYFDGKISLEDGRDVQYANGVKSDDTGLAGAGSQKFVVASRNDTENLAHVIEAMYAPTQATLQIKKDPDHARRMNDALTMDLPRTLNGKTFDGKKDLTPSMLKSQLTELFDDKMGVDVAEDHIDGIVNVMTVDGQVKPLKEVMAIKGSPMDRVAYGGGIEELGRIADKGESLLDGERSKQFAPFSMRNATAETVIAKKDTQRVAVEPEVESQVEVLTEPAVVDVVSAPEKPSTPTMSYSQVVNAPEVEPQPSFQTAETVTTTPTAAVDAQREVEPVTVPEIEDDGPEL